MSEKNQDKQLTIEAKTLLGSLEKQSERVAKGIEEFDKRLKELSDTNLMMQNTPRKFADKLEEKIPRIVEELHKSVIHEMNVVKEKYNEEMLMHETFLKGSESHIQSHLDDFTRLEKSKIKRFFFVVLISTAIASGVAAFTANYVTDKYLRRVQIANPNQVILQDSDVTVMDMPHHKVYQQQDRKKKKK